MADYTPILDTQTDPDAPLTSDLAKAWAENPVAIAEGAIGAPKVMGKAVNILAGTFASDGAFSTAITNLGYASKLFVSGTASGNTTLVSGGPMTISYQRSSDNGVSWGASTVIAVSNDSSDNKGFVAGSAIVDMVGFNAVRLATIGATTGPSVSGVAICVVGE